MTLAICTVIAGCKPPPTDAALDREVPEEEPTFASDPLPSPDTEGALWAKSADVDRRIVYGVPGNQALLTLECVQPPGTSPPALVITRLAPADEGAGALIALIGNGHMERFSVDATQIGSRTVWQGSAPAASTHWEPLVGTKSATATVPGAGKVALNPSALPGNLVEACRTGQSIAATADADLNKEP